MLDVWMFDRNPTIQTVPASLVENIWFLHPNFCRISAINRGSFLFCQDVNPPTNPRSPKVVEKTAATIGFTLRNNMYIHTNFIKLHSFHWIWNPKGSFFRCCPIHLNGIEGWNHTPSLVLLSDTILLGFENHEVSNAKHPSSVVFDVSFWLTSLNLHLYHPQGKHTAHPLNQCHDRLQNLSCDLRYGAPK